MTSGDLTTRLFDDTNASPLDPFEIFEAWLSEAQDSEPNDPTAMALATVDADGMPDVRMVLMNAHDARGPVFFTNAESAKGEELAANPRAALLFHWKSLRRQVRFRGSVEQVTNAEADAYFATRHPRSQIGAHASAQSRPLANRHELLDRAETLAARFEGQPVPRPAYWTGYRLKPEQVEFWKDGEYRLHDRVLFTRQGTQWTRQRLNP